MRDKSFIMDITSVHFIYDGIENFFIYNIFMGKTDRKQLMRHPLPSRRKNAVPFSWESLMA
jgi:hypothetical protein